MLELFHQFEKHGVTAHPTPFSVASFLHTQIWKVVEDDYYDRLMYRRLFVLRIDFSLLDVTSPAALRSSLASHIDGALRVLKVLNKQHLNDVPDASVTDSTTGLLDTAFAIIVSIPYFFRLV